MVMGAGAERDALHLVVHLGELVELVGRGLLQVTHRRLHSAGAPAEEQPSKGCNACRARARERREQTRDSGKRQDAQRQERRNDRERRERERNRDRETDREEMRDERR